MQIFQNAIQQLCESDCVDLLMQIYGRSRKASLAVRSHTYRGGRNKFRNHGHARLNDENEHQRMKSNGEECHHRKQRHQSPMPTVIDPLYRKKCSGIYSYDYEWFEWTKYKCTSFFWTESCSMLIEKYQLTYLPICFPIITTTYAAFMKLERSV